MLKVSSIAPFAAAFALSLAACDQQPASDSSQAPDPQSQQQSAVPAETVPAGEEKIE